MGKFDDKGILSPNKFRKGNDRAPTHTGIIDIGRDTLKALLVSMKDTGEAKLEISGWRKTDKPDMLSLKIQIPRERSEGGSRSRSRDDDDDRPARRSDRRRDDDEEDDRPRRNARRDDDDEPPFERSRSRNRDDEYDDREERSSARRRDSEEEL